MNQQGPEQGTISILNVGTKILMRDAMDHFLRTLGDIRTYYARNMKSALRTFSESMIHVIVCEAEFEDGSAQRLIQNLGGRSVLDDLWIILAVEEDKPELMALALELEVNGVLVKPFSGADLKNHIEKYKARKVQVDDPALIIMKDAEIAMKEKRNFDADKKYREAMMASPQNPYLQYKLGMYFLSKPDYKFAEQCFKKALDLKPNYVSAISALGVLALNRGKLEDAHQLLQQAHNISPYNTDRALLLTKYHVQNAAEGLNSILMFDSSDAMTRLELGKLLIFERDYVGGITNMEQALPNLTGDRLKECQTYMALARKLGGLQKD